MPGIVNSTGARSGVIGTTVGTPAGGKVLQVKSFTKTNTASTTNDESAGLHGECPNCGEHFDGNDSEQEN